MPKFSFIKSWDSAIAVLEDNIFANDYRKWGSSVANLIEQENYLRESIDQATTLTEAERRKEPRFTASLPVYHRIKPQYSRWMTTHTIDVSQNGIRLSLSKPVKTGTLLELQIKLPGNKKHLQLKGMIVWQKPSLNGENWEVGIAFENFRQHSRKEKIINFMADRLCGLALGMNYHMATRNAATKEDLFKAYSLVYREYLRRKYVSENKSGLHYSAYCLLPESRTFILEEAGNVIGTISLVVDSPCGLPMEKEFGRLIRAYRRPGRRIAEVTLLTLDHHHFGHKSFSLTDLKKLAGIFALFKRMFDYARYSAQVTDLFIAMHPRHKELYHYLTFKPIGPVQSYAGAKNHPALPMKMDIKETELTLPQDLSIYRYFIKEAIPLNELKPGFEWHTESLHDFLFKHQNLWHTLDSRTQQGLREIYPALTPD